MSSHSAGCMGRSCRTRNTSKQGGRSMSAPNGHGSEDGSAAGGPPLAMWGNLAVPAERVKELVAFLDSPVESAQIEWRVMKSTKNQEPMGGRRAPACSEAT